MADYRNIPLVTLNMSSAEVNRIKLLRWHRKELRKKPEVVLVCGGTNDTFHAHEQVLRDGSPYIQRLIVS